MTTEDMDLVREYARCRSEEAFSALVSRHVNLVYSVAQRQLRDPHLAEEVTQATFIVLARKAGALGPKTIVSAWLCRTAQFTAAQALRTQRRRQTREQEAYMQNQLNEPASDSSAWSDIAPVLDAAMARLGEKDHSAIVLRFFEGRDLKQVGAALGVSENTAKTRVSRAVEKLRKLFTKQGINLSADVITGAIATHSVQTAPVTLAKSVTAIALSKGAAVSVSTLTLAKASLIIMKTKTAVITVSAVAAFALALATGMWLVARARAHGHFASGEAVPLRIVNDSFSADGNRDGRFLVEVDSNTRRATDSAPAIHIKGPIPPAPVDGDYLRSDNSSSFRYFVGDDSPLLGKHIRVTGWVKTSNVRNWAGVFVIMESQGNTLYFDDMADRPIRGTTDWQQVELVTDVPKDSCYIYFGPDLYGPGELWSDDFQIDLAPAGAPITDVRNWRLAGETFSFNYSAAADPLTTHDGKPAVCVTYASEGAPPNGSFTQWQKRIATPDIGKYLGHTLRMSGWIKTENVTGRFDPNIRPCMGHYKLVAKDRKIANCNLNGTHDWSQFTVTCTIPTKTEYIETGFRFSGAGKAWIDMDSVKCEIVK